VATITQPGRPDRVERRYRLASPVTATVLAGLTLVVLAMAITLNGLTGQLSVLSSGPIVPVVVIYAGVGVVVARRQPRNPIGWLLIIFILVFLLSTVVGSYAVLYYRFGHHGLPLAPVAVMLQPLWAPALLLFPVVILLFPDGRLASRRWRWMLLAYAVAGALASAAIFAPAVTAVAGHDVHLDAFGDVTSGGRSQHGLLAVAELLGLLLILVAWLSFVGHQVLSWRRAVGERRQQLKWLASGATVTVVVIAASFGINAAGIAGQVLGTGLAALPVGIGVGILKYRLYEIDRIISRAVSYVIVTGLLVGVYAGLVLLATEVIRVKSPVAVAVSTLVAAALFSPLRRRVQHVVDRRFNRARYDADEAVTAFAARLQDAVDLASVQDDLTGVVQRALEPAHVSVWLGPRG
jgi:MFS family permease